MIAIVGKKKRKILPGVGFEPTRTIRPLDLKSNALTTRPSWCHVGCLVKNLYFNKDRRIQSAKHCEWCLSVHVFLKQKEIQYYL